MNSPDQNDSLSRTLAEWRVRPPTAPNFRPAVWERIKQRTRDTWAGYLRAHLVSWSLAGVMAVLAAGWTGPNVAQAKLDAGREKMVVSYLVDLDPRVLAKLPHQAP